MFRILPQRPLPNAELTHLGRVARVLWTESRHPTRLSFASALDGMSLKDRSQFVQIVDLFKSNLGLNEVSALRSVHDEPVTGELFMPSRKGLHRV
jgi:hypothetical protein